MKITALVENQTRGECKGKHGLALYIETNTHTILFDLGPDNTLFENARIKGMDLSKVDTVIISHGHMDHGQALEAFLEINKTAKIYVQRKAFESHYCKFLFLKIKVGLNQKLQTHPQVYLLDGDFQIDDELKVFTVNRTEKCYSPANDALYTKNKKDDFLHEQNLMIQEEENVLIMGCGHTGLINIMEKAMSDSPGFCLGGYHLYNPLTKKTVSEGLLQSMLQELQKYKEVEFYTCHCTGTEAYEFFAKNMPNMHYLSCGDTINVTKNHI